MGTILPLPPFKASAMVTPMNGPHWSFSRVIIGKSPHNSTHSLPKQIMKDDNCYSQLACKNEVDLISRESFFLFFFFHHHSAREAIDRWTERRKKRKPKGMRCRGEAVSAGELVIGAKASRRRA